MPIPAPPPATDEQEFTNVRPIGQGKAAPASTSEFTNIRPISGSSDIPDAVAQSKARLASVVQPISATPPPSRAEKWWTTPTPDIAPGNVPGVEQELPSASSPRETFQKGAAVEGVMGAPALIGAAIAAPLATTLGIAGGVAGGKVGGYAGRKVGEQVGSPELGQDIGEGIGGLAGGVGGAKAMRMGRKAPIEDIFRGAGPPTDPNFRASVETAANDLGVAYQKYPIPAEAKGSLIKAGPGAIPDKRVRAAVESINSHLKDMYTQERAAQIARGSQIGAQVQVATDPAILQDVSKRLTRTLPINDPSIAVASKLLADPAATLTIDEADALARATNTMLRDYQSMTPAERAAANVTSRKLNGLKQLDQGLSTGINGRLQAIGLPGLADYEQRYAALSSVRDALQSKMNKAEAARFALRLREFFSPGAGAHGAVSTSLFEKSPGRLVKSGMKELAGNATPFAGLPAPPPPKGLLPAPPTEAGWNYEGGAPSAGKPKVWTPQEQDQLRRSQLPAPPPVAQVGGPPPPAGFPPTTPSTMWTGSQPKPGFAAPTEMTSATRPPANVKGPSVTANAANPTAAASKATQAPATGSVKTVMTELNMHDLITPRQQKTIATMLAGPQWRSMDSVDKRAAISKIINGATF